MDCQITMPFDFYRGACNTFSQPDPKVLLCFDFGDYNNLGNKRECYT